MTFAAIDLCKYTLKFMLCKVLPGKEHLGLDILRKTLHQVKGTNGIIKTTCNTGAIYYQKASKRSNSPLSSKNKVVKYVHALLFYNNSSQNN